MTVDWRDVVERATATLERGDRLDAGQRDSLAWIIGRLREAPGVVLADEVGTGKTRIACAVIHAVIAAGGRVATVVPKGLMHQWIAESRELHSLVEAKTLTTLPEMFRRALTEDWARLAPRPDAPEWWLISHGFRVPQVRTNSNIWRAALPALVELQLASATDRKDRRTREGRLQEWIGLADDAKHSTERWAYWDGMELLARDLAPRVRPQRDIRRAMKKLPDVRIITQNGRRHADMDIEAFRDAEGERTAEKLLGLWLGEFDFIVVDEAHKSRGVVEDDSAPSGTAKVLSRLLGTVLKRTSTSRCLCLTATPMELDLLQWSDLLDRAGCHIDDEGKEALEALKQATREAVAAPDEVERLDSLCKAAATFTRTLEPYVTRRRRTEDALIQEFRASGAGENGPHPHRRVEAVPIAWSDPGVRASAWIDVLFAAECMSHAARGLTKADTDGWPSAIKDAYTKLCKGHVSADFDGDAVTIEIPSPKDGNEHTRGKIKRVNYWYEQLREARERVASGGTAGDGLVESEHPRITLAVREIERWTEAATGNGPRDHEKVLVFGVFLRPLVVLRNVLNVRNTLRAIDAGRPIAHSIDRNTNLMAIALRQLDRMRHDGAIFAQLATAGESELKRALRKAHQEYGKLQSRLRREIRLKINAWSRNPCRLGGIDRSVLDNVHAHTLAFVLDELLSDASTGHGPRRDRVSRLTEEYFEQHIAPELRDTLNEEEDDDDIRTKALRALFGDDETLQRWFAVLLAGDTRPTTRRYIQAAFNRQTSSPRVLIAQSQVGREGLNLHESCRVVIQFHAEWNPAVLEQQIGRVDRKNSRWEQIAKQWLDGDRVEPPPYIEVRRLVFEGTYDAYQWERVARRQQMFDASLFGSLLAEGTWARVPSDWVARLEAAAPSFRPPRYHADPHRKR